MTDSATPDDTRDIPRLLYVGDVPVEAHAEHAGNTNAIVVGTALLRPLANACIKLVGGNVLGG